MKLTNAIKKMSKYGDVKNISYLPQYENRFCVQIKNWILQVTKNGTEDSVATIYVKREDCKDDMQSDYFAGSFFDNMSQALRFIERMINV